MLSKREKQILIYLEDESFLSAQSIANKLGISSRTVRSDIVSINQKMNGIAEIVSFSGVGYQLCIKDENSYRKTLNQSQQDIPETPEDRVNYILSLFLKQDGYIKVEDLAHKLYQSERTVSLDLQEVRNRIAKYNLKIINRPKYGMLLQGDEKKQRELESDVLQYTKQKQQELRQEKIADILKNVLAEHDFILTEFAFTNLVMHLSITIDRIRQDKLIYMSEDSFNELKDSKVYLIAEDIAHSIETGFNCVIPESECAYISMHLLGKRLHSTNENTVIPREYSVFVHNQLDHLSEEYHIDFAKDLNLQLALSVHMIPLAYRMKYDLRMKNPLLDQIKTNYTHAYIIAKTFSHALSDYFKKSLSQDEIGYLALHFNLSMEKELKDIRKKNVILVCATGLGTAKLLEHQYREQFGNYLNTLVCCDAGSLANQNYNDIDFIFTTVPIHVPVPVPVIEVGFILDHSQINKIESSMNEVSSMEKYFRNELFFCDLEADTPKEAIRFLIHEAEKFHSLPENFETLVMQREELFPTAFDNGVSLPHPYKVCTQETFGCVALFKEPILWGDKPVKMVFLISLSNIDDADIQKFYGRLSKLLVSDTLLNEVYTKKSFTALLEILNSLEP